MYDIDQRKKDYALFAPNTRLKYATIHKEIYDGRLNNYMFSNMSTKKKRTIFAITSAIVLMTGMVVYSSFAWFGERNPENNISIGESGVISGQAGVGRFVLSSEIANGATTLFDGENLLPGGDPATAHPITYTNNGTTPLTLQPELLFSGNTKAMEYFIGVEKRDKNSTPIYKQTKWYVMQDVPTNNAFETFDLSLKPNEKFIVTVNVRVSGPLSTNKDQGTKVGADLKMNYKQPM